MNNLDGKSALVTGAARGIGAGIARLLAAHGASVVINYRASAGDARRLRDDIIRSGGAAHAVPADVTKPEEARNLVLAALREFGKIDILVNNAGDFLFKKISDVSIEEWHAAIDSNLHSGFYCTRAALEDMRRRSWGRIVNIADMRAEKISAQPMKTAYAIAKSGILQLTRALAAAEAPHGITVNAVSPGYIDCGNYSETFMKKTVGKIPMKRLGAPEDIAQAVLFLVSDGASYVTGANIEVTGGAGL